MKKILFSILSLCAAGAAFAEFAIDRSVMSEKYWQIWNDAEQAKIDADIEANRKADVEVKIRGEGEEGGVTNGTPVSVEQLDHAFRFGAHIFNYDQLGKKEYNDAYKASYGPGGLFNQATVAFYWNAYEPVPGRLRAHGDYEDTAQYWNSLSRDEAMEHPFWRRPAPGPVIDFLKRRGVAIHGHILVWGYAKPDWIYDAYCPEAEKRTLDALGIPRNDPLAVDTSGEWTGGYNKRWRAAWDKVYAREGMTETALAAQIPVFARRMPELFRKRVRDVADAFGEVVDSWDVVNESSGDWARYGRSQTDLPVWFSRYGLMPGDYPLRALLDAKAALPATARLAINDWNVGEEFLAQVNDLQAAGAKIDLVGCQMHIFDTNDCARLAAGESGHSWIDTPGTIEERLDLMAKTGRPIHISEITITSPGDDPKSRMIQAVLVRNAYRKWFSHKAVMGITWWNTVDGAGVKGEPLVSGLFTADLKKKPAYEALDELINHEWKTKLEVKVEGEGGQGKIRFRGFRGRYRLTWKDAAGEVRTKLIDVGEPAASSERDLTDLVAKMTLAEKVGQLVQLQSSMGSTGAQSKDASAGRVSDELAARIRKGEVGSLIGACGIAKFNALQKIAVEESRLGIPLMVGHDMIHGVATQFPIPLALSCAWDEKLWEDCGRLIARETPTKGCNWTFAPMCDIARDARWGRIAEGAGQDPLLDAKMTAALVKGIQSGEGAVPVAACLKHFVGYGAAEGGRDYNTVELSESTLRNVYLPPFAAGVKAGALTVMPSFNTLNGVPMSLNRPLLRDVLRGELGFNGFTISDWEAIGECRLERHGMGADDGALAAKALTAGMDQDMLANVYAKALADQVRNGTVSAATLDASVLNVLRVKAALGLFEKPYIAADAAAKVDIKADAALAREAAAKSFVLLKNGEKDKANGPLPLAPKAKVALVGPGLEDVANLTGSWASYEENQVNCRVSEGFRAAGIDFTAVQGYDFRTGTVDRVALTAAVEGADVIVAAFGEHGRDAGEGQSRLHLALPGVQKEALAFLKATGKPLVALVFAGRPLALPELAEAADAILLVWSPGTSAGDAIADVLTGKVAPEGRLTTEFPYHPGATPLYYNRLATGRPAPGSMKRFRSTYRDEPYWALYPFGYGLTYTTFAYANETVAVKDGVVTLAADVTNTGTREGVETAQAYTRQMVGETSRPIRELRGWKKVTLKPGETRRVEIAFPVTDLAYWVGREKVAAEGPMQAFLAPDSNSGRALRFGLPETISSR